MLGIVRGPIVLERLIEAVRDNRYGAIVTFSGVVRARSDDNRQISGLSYEAYEKMVLLQMEEIIAQACANFGDCAIAMVHRTGELLPGESSVAVAVAAPHRKAAFMACEFAIDALKERAAVWKKEHFGDATRSIWRENPGALESGR